MYLCVSASDSQRVLLNLLHYPLQQLQAGRAQPSTSVGGHLQNGDSSLSARLFSLLPPSLPPSLSLFPSLPLLLLPPPFLSLLLYTLLLLLLLSNLEAVFELVPCLAIVPTPQAAHAPGRPHRNCVQLALGGHLHCQLKLVFLDKPVSNSSGEFWFG